MKAILEFNLDEQFDEISHKRCVKSLDMALCLLEITRLDLPKKSKDKIWQLIESYDVDPDKLVI